MFRVNYDSEFSTEPADFRDAFDIFDEDKNGEISLDELRKMLTSVGQKPTDHDLRKIFEAADKDSENLTCTVHACVYYQLSPKYSGPCFSLENGTIDFKEFVTIIQTCPKSDLKDELKSAFRVFDKDGSGAITVMELKQVRVAD